MVTVSIVLHVTVHGLPSVAGLEAQNFKNLTKMNKDLTATFGNTMLYAAFSVIPLDVEGSNLQNKEWLPNEEDVEFWGEQSYKFAKEEYDEAEKRVIFKNVFLQWDSSDYNDYSTEYIVYEIHIKTKDKIYIIEYEDGESLIFEGYSKSVKIPVDGATIFDFIRACQMCEIDLEFSDYALSLLK